jgi:putative transposase
MGTRHRQELEKFPLRFVTTTCKDWLHLLQSHAIMQIVADSLTFLNGKYKVQIVGYVFMPNHIHMLMFLEDGKTLSSYMRDFKKFTSVKIRKQLEAEEQYSLVEQMRFIKGAQKLKVWQDRFDDFYITNPKSFLIKLNYIHNNPLKRGLAKSAADYKYSSAGYYERETEGILKINHFMAVIGAANQYQYGSIY